MPHPAADTTVRLRRTVYGLLIVTCLGVTLGHIAAIRSPLRGSPMLSANDRSRWATIRALVDDGTFAIDDVIFTQQPQIPANRDREWYTIDMVRHPGRDGQEHYYSSKPPLLTVLLAGEYWLVQRLSGATLAEQPFYVIRLMLIASNVVPLALYFLLLVRFVERFGQTDWGRLFVMTAAVFGTFLTTFAVTLNNHLPAAICLAIAVWSVLPLWDGDRPRLWRLAVAGFFAALTAASELPALSFAALLAAVLFWKSPRQTLVAFVPAALVVAAAASLTNYAAHGSWRPPYAHRRDGVLLAALPGTFDAELNGGKVPEALRGKLAEIEIRLSPQTEVRPRATAAGWGLWDPTHQRRLALVAGPAELRVHAWDNWYDYDGSYWTGDQKTGVDLGEPSRAAYAFHVLLGHHGVFSLTPIWLLSAWGVGISLARGGPWQRTAALFVAVLTLVCLGFYIVGRPLEDRNYGGVTSGFRWVFWLTPLWLLALLPAADALADRRVWRWVAVGLLLISVFSAAYPALNPWSHPWLYQYWDSLGWLP